ncbi:MAG: S-layer homology domain-containing protein [Clostridia bacterium]|nr:S-layer homology domain-containing protein [Clostridia bacterium]
MKKILVVLAIISLLCVFGVAASALSAADIPAEYPYRGEVGNMTMIYVNDSEKPVMDGKIDKSSEIWGKYTVSMFQSPVSATLNDKNMHPFWTYRSLVITEISPYFYYSDEGVYVAAYVYDRTVQPSTGYDDTADLDHEGEGPLGSDYAFNGDTFIFCFDPMGTVMSSGDGSDQAPHYCITYYDDGSCHVARTRIGNDADITSEVTASAQSFNSLKSWSFEVLIPWSVIIEDVESITGVTLKAEDICANGVKSTANVIYADRCTYYRGDANSGFWKEYPGEHHNDGDVFMVSRSITVATVIKNDGQDMLGIYGSGDNVKSHGIKLTNAKVCSGGHTEGETITLSEPDCILSGRKITVCADCGMIMKTEESPALGHKDSDWVVKQRAGCVTDGIRVKICPVCGREWKTEAIPSVGYHTPEAEWQIKAYPSRPFLGVRFKKCTECGETVITERFFEPKLWENPYVDVADDSWYHDSVAYVSGNYYMTGTGDGVFSPDTKMTRAMFVLVLGKIADINTSKFRSSYFVDVKIGSWYAPYVQWAVENGIVSGVGDNRFAPDDMITREQLAVMMMKFAEKFKGDISYDDEALDKYADYGDISDYALTALKWAVSKGLISGMTEDTVGPQGIATRAQVSVIVMKFCEGIGSSIIY